MGIEKMNELIDENNDINLEKIEEDEREIIKQHLLENPSLLLDIAREANSWDGRFEWTDVWELEELCQCISDPYEIVRAVVYGDVTNVDDFVRYDAYGNLENVSEYELEQESINDIDLIIDTIYDLYPKHISICDDELIELLNI